MLDNTRAEPSGAALFLLFYPRINRIPLRPASCPAKSPDGIDEKPYSAYVTRITPLELGPPVGWSIKYCVQGSDSEKVRQIAQRLTQELGNHSEIHNINLTSGEPQRAIRIKVNQTQARLAGLSGEQVAQALRTYYSGAVVTRVRSAARLKDFVLRPREGDQQDTMNLATMLIRNSTGVNVPLSQVATVSWGTGNAGDRAPQSRFTYYRTGRRGIGTKCG